MNIKKLSYYGLVTFFVFAGLYHFVNPEFYYPLIPDYLPYKKLINIGSGVIEIGLGLLLLNQKWQKYASFGLIALLVLFIPSHIHFVMIGSCIEGGLCVPEWVGYLRLIVIHPLLIYWVYMNKK